MTSDSTSQQQLSADIAIVGWGKAGKTFAGRAAQAGKKVILIERDSGMIGGACINVACIPTKALLHSATLGPGNSAAPEYFQEAIAARDALTAKLNSANRKMLVDADGVTIVMGQAEFLEPKKLRVDTGSGESLIVGAETVIINTGSAPRRLDVPGAQLPHVHDSITIQHLSALPRSLAIVGGGVVALEFAQMFASFGAAVTIIARGDLLADAEPELRELFLERLSAAGVRLISGAEVREVSATAVHTNQGEVAADAVLVAIGRVPNLPEGTAEVGIALDKRGFVAVDEHLRSSVSGVYAAGDANGGPQLTYISLDDSRILAAELLAAPSRTTADRRAVPQVIFGELPFASVGLSEAAARAQGLNVAVAVKDVADLAMVPRPKTLGKTAGRVKVVVDSDTDTIVGFSHLGVDAQEVVNVVALAMRMGARVSDLRDGIWLHLSTTELLNEIFNTLH